jgi:diacylglycerol kinase
MQSWFNKFRCAFRGTLTGIVGQSSFFVHIPATLLVPLMAYLLNCSAWQWCILGLCIGLVWALELFNSALEYLARGVCKEQNVEVGKALDTASGAVLVGAVTAVLVGGGILLYQLLLLFQPKPF